MGSALLLLALSFILASNAAAQGVPTLSITGDTVGTVRENLIENMAVGKLTITDGTPMDYTFVVQTGAGGTYGTFEIDADGDWIYTLNNADPDTNALAEGVMVTDIFPVVAFDDATVNEVVTITITGANDRPTITNVTLSPAGVDEGESVSLTGMANDVDTGNMLTYGWSAEPNLGSFTHADVTRVDATWRAPDSIGDFKLILTVIDDSGTPSNSSTSQSNIRVSEASLEIIGNTMGAVTEDATLNTASGMLTIDTTANNRDFVPQTDTGMYGTFEIDDGGAWTYILDNNAPATNALAAGAEVTDTFTVASSLRPTSDTQEVTITVTGANDAPEFDPTSYDFDLAENRDGSTAPIEVGTVTATDPEGDTIAYSITVGNTALFSIDEDSGAITYMGTGEDFEAGPRIYTLEITATANSQPDTAPVTVTITDANDAPVASITEPAANTEVNQGVVVRLTGTGDDDDTGDTLGYAWSASPDVGSFTNGDTLDATWAAPDALGAVTLTLTVTDNSGAVNDSGTDTVMVMVTEAPLEIRGDTVGMVTENAPSNITNGALTIATTANDRNFVQTDTPVPGIYGSFTINANGAWTYTLDNIDPDTNALAAGDGVTDPFTVISNLQPAVIEVVTITITGANDAPVATDDAFTVLEGGTATMLTGGEISVLANDDDVDAGTTLMVVPVEMDLSNGMLTLNGDGTFSYTHDGSENHDDLFTYRASDGIADSNDATVTITVTPQDDAPEFDPASYDFTLEENRDGSTMPVAVGTVTATDAESDPITYGISSGLFSIDGNSGAITYTGTGENFEAGPRIYTLDVTATANSQTATATVTVMITDANDAPVVSITAPANDVEVKQGVSVFLSGEGNDEDTGDTLSYAWSASPDVGSFTNGDTLNATWATPDALDPVMLTLTVTDDSGDVNDSGTDSVTVTIIRAPLEIRGDTVGMVTEDATIITANGGLDIITTASDRNFVQTDTPVPGTYGTFTINANGAWTYTLDNTDPDTNALDAGDGVTDDPFTVMSRLQPTVTEVVTITITGANDAPVARDDAFTVLEGGTATMLTGGVDNVLANDEDVDAEATLMVVPVGMDVSNGTLTLNNDGTFSYTHDGSENHDDSFTYRASDGIAQSNDATVTITVTPQDDAPEFDQPSYEFNLAENQDGSATSVDVGTVAATDPEGDAITYGISSGDTTLFSIDGTSGAITYTGTGEDFEPGPRNYTLDVTATANSDTATATVTVMITDVNEPPEFDPVSYDFDLEENQDGRAAPIAVGTVTATDPEDDSITYSITTGDLNRFSIDGASGAITYTGAGEDFEAEPMLTYPLVVTATANSQTGTAPVTVTITDANDAPVARDDAFTVLEDGIATMLTGGEISVLANDDDVDAGATLMVMLVDNVRNGTLMLNQGDGTFSYDHDGSENHDDSFTYRASDGIAQSNDATVTITVTPQDDAPVFDPASYEFNLAENQDGSTTLVAVGTVTATDAERDSITYGISSGDTTRFNIDVTNGAIAYTGAGEDFEAGPSTYTLDVTATANSQTATAPVTVMITDENDVPVAEAGAAQTVGEGTSGVTLDGSGSTDMDPGALNYAWTQTEGMTVTLTGDDTISPTFTAPTGLSEDETLTFQLIVTDVGGQPSEPDTVIITVATPPTFGDTVIEIQRYTTGFPVSRVTLPEPTSGGDGMYTYTVDNQNLPRGVSFDDDATTRAISGTVTAPPGRATHTYTVTDGRNATDTISFDTIIVNPPSFGTATFPDLTFVVRDPVNLILPPATEGSPPLSYRLERAFDNGPLPIGLSFVDRGREGLDERVLSGMPSRVQDNEYRYIATDANGAEALAAFRITIEANRAPTFGATTPPLAFTFARGITIPDRTLPEATGGNGVLSYDIVEPLPEEPPFPEGLSFDPVNRILSGTPTTEQAATAYTYRVQDEDGNTEAADAADLIFSIEIIAPSITFGGTNTGMVTEDGPDRLPENDDEAGTTSSAAGTLTIINPGGDTSFIALTEIGTYGLFNIASNGEWTYTLDNGEDTTQELAHNASAGDTFNVVATAFDGITHPVSITVAGANDAPGVLLISGIPTIMEPEEFIVLSALGTDVDSGETDTLSYQWSTDPPDRGSFDAPTSAETGWAAPAVTEYEDIDLILTVDDGSGTDTSSDTIEVTVRIVAVNVLPGFNESIDNQTYTLDAEISALTLPEAANGNPPFRYNITPDLPTGLSFNPGTRVLSGTPTMIPSPPTGVYTYTVTDSDSTATDTVDDSGMESLMFNITINRPLIFGGINTGTVTEDTTSRATGRLTITNPIPGGDINFVALTDIDGTYGTFSVTTDGIWTYILDNGRMATQELLSDDGFGLPGTDTFTVMAAADPNVLQTITITVDGADDAPTVNIIAPADRATVAAGATIAITAIGMDVDSGQTDRLSYQWITEPPGQGSFTAPSLPDTVWTAPTVDTDLDIMLRLSVFDDNELEGNAAVTLVVEVASPNDVNADAIVQVRDLQIIYYVALSPPNLDALLNRLRGIAADVAQLSARATAWLNRNPAEVTPDPDLNGDGTLNQQDARILYYALRFEDELRASPALQQALGVNMLALQSALDLRDE